MFDDHLPYLLGYPASFCRTPAEARANLLRMIEAGIPGWNDTPASWAAGLRAQLARPNRTRKLNRYGAAFSATEWVQLMRALLADCERLAAASAVSTATQAAANAAVADPAAAGP